MTERTRASRRETLNEDPEKNLDRREIINLFMGCGILQTHAQMLYQNTPDLIGSITNRHTDDMKLVLREAISILDKEGVPEVIYKPSVMADPSGGVDEGATKTRPKTIRCRVCGDSPAIKVSHPVHMSRYFRRFREFKGRVTKDDWLCKNCYGDWYRENKEDLLAGKLADVENESDEDGVPNDTADDTKSVSKEFYLKSILFPLFMIVKHLDASAISHRKMLVRYVTKGSIRTAQIATALHFLRKLGSGIIDVEEFEKECGIGQYEDLFGYSSWKREHTQVEILKVGHADKIKKRQEKMQAKLDKEAQENKDRQEEKAEKERQDRLAMTVIEAEREALDKAKTDRARKLQDERRHEDQDTSDRRKKEDQDALKMKDRQEAEKKTKKKEREQAIRDMDHLIKQKEAKRKERKEDRAMALRTQQKIRESTRLQHVRM
eukprot:TRINITY_DN7800_c0_g1_i1.p1 TRINITY_DN7800_c0_g1~~TRINITY_DN7800_c0_g1_i1.p1  ORF type:complete len:435 (+),score=140.74 TRINITY_DN7800_c0_g1_i1:1-1305(+)